MKPVKFTGLISLTLALFMTESSAIAISPPFDLSCVQTEVGIEFEGRYQASPSNKMENRHLRLSLDESKHIWCYQPCRIVGEAEFFPSEIRLSGGPIGLGPSFSLIDRNSGIMIHAIPLNKYTRLMSTYECTKGKFTAIPATKF